jgi:SpoVK/Ycf46/Vps4 family AAA+-type ATPase
MGATTSSQASSAPATTNSTPSTAVSTSTTTSEPLNPMPLQVEIVHIERGEEEASIMATVIHYSIQFLEIVAVGLIGQYLLDQIDPRAEEKAHVRSTKGAMIKRLKKLGRDYVDPSTFTSHEMKIFADVVAPSEVMVSFDEIGGYKDQKERIIHSLCMPEETRAVLYNSYGSMAEPPKGILLHGPPGCGKTLLAKAIATECNASFINLKISHVTDKWHGESQKLTDAVFSLARKLAPTIVFVDEVDTFLRDRGMPGASMESATTGQMKASFLSNWDGLTSGKTERKYVDEDGKIHSTQIPFEIVVVGATNRAGDIDEAFLRRMPLQLELVLPDLRSRTHILSIMFQKMKKVPKCNPKDLAKLTNHYSGSDLKELCRRAVMERVMDVVKNNAKPRAVEMSDFQNVFENGMAPAGTASVNYKYKQKVADALKNNGVVGGMD